MNKVFVDRRACVCILPTVRTARLQVVCSVEDRETDVSVLNGASRILNELK